MRYILSVPGPLGHLEYITVWHDNSGEGGEASWYLDSAVIKDLQTDERQVKYLECLNISASVE